MTTAMSGKARHRRRIRYALPVGAAGVAAAVAAALMSSTANAAPALPKPTAKPAVDSPSRAELERRVAGALTQDDTPGRTTAKASLSATTSGGTDTSTSSGTISPYIIGGSTTTISSAPWMAQLWYYDDKGTASTTDDIGFFCGGSVISPSKILTAAHCVKGYNWKANGTVVTSTDQLPTDDGAGGADIHGGQATGVLRQWNHKSYDPSTINNDVAVLTLGVPVKATPIRMVTSGDTASYAAGTSAKLYGWGRTSSATQDISQTLKTATLPIQSDTTCAGYYKTEFVKGHMVCAGKPASGSNTGTTSACNGDSGGPLVVGGRIAGVVSWGVTNCVKKGAYSVFTKVSSYVGTAYPQAEDSNMSYSDNKADVFLRNSSTKTAYEKDSKGTSFGTTTSLGSWSAVNLYTQADLNRDGYQDDIYRIGSTGDVYWDHFVINAARDDGSWVTTKLFSNWKTRTRIITPGDVNGDYKPDILSVDSGGKLWVYPGKGNGTFGAPFSVSTGWGQYNAVVGHGDFTGDGKADLIARKSSTGDLYLYKGTSKTGSGAFSARIKVRSAYTGYNRFAAVGDFTGDGKADLLARTTGGTLYLYPGTGSASSSIFGTRVSLGTGYQKYDLIG